MSKKPIFSDERVKRTNIVMRACVVLILLLVAVLLVLALMGKCPLQTTKALVLIAIAMIFEARRDTMLENHAIYKATIKQSENKESS